MAKLDKYQIYGEQESVSNTVNVTSYPVEKGFPITDSVERKPKTLSVSGYILGKRAKDADTIAAAIEKLQNKGKLVSYVGRMKVSDVIITKFDRDYSADIANGFSCSFDLQEIRIAKTPYVKKKTKKKVSGKKTVKKKKSTKVYHKVKPGDTYWGMWKKYGTPINTLRKWNKYPDRRIPIGVKLRVK